MKGNLMLNLVFALALAGNPTLSPEAKPAPELSLRASSAKSEPRTMLIDGKAYRVYVLDGDSPLDRALETYLNEALKRQDTHPGGESSAPAMKSYLD
jgi:hypothetical protein